MANKSSYLTEGVFLAGIPAVGYWVSYLYELGYFSHFKLPKYLIEITVNTILLNCLIILIGVVVGVFIIDFVRRRMHGSSLAIQVVAFQILVAFFISFGFYIAFELSVNAFRLLLFFTVGPVIFRGLIYPLWSQRRVKGFVKKLDAAMHVDFEFESLTGKFGDKIGMDLFIAAAFLYFVSLLAYFLGGMLLKMSSNFIRLMAIPIIFW